MADNDIAGIIIASIPGWFALIIAFIGLYERRMEKRDAKKISDALAETKKEEEEKAAIYKQVAAELALENERKANGIVTRVEALEIAVNEALELLGAPKTKRPVTRPLRKG